VIVPLTQFLENNGITGTGNRRIGFDGSGHTYPESEFPSGRITLRGVPYDLVVDGDDNFAARGQAIDLPDGRFGALSLLAASSYGPAGGTATFQYTDGSTTVARIEAPDWIEGDTGVLHADFFNTKDRDTVDQSVNIYALTILLDPAKTVTSVRLPATEKPGTDAASMHVFAMTLVPPRASGTG
jgi:alpha-L-fucosidase